MGVGGSPPACRLCGPLCGVVDWSLGACDDRRLVVAVAVRLATRPEAVVVVGRAAFPAAPGRAPGKVIVVTLLRWHPREAVVVAVFFLGVAVNVGGAARTVRGGAAVEVVVRVLRLLVLVAAVKRVVPDERRSFRVNSQTDSVCFGARTQPPWA